MKISFLGLLLQIVFVLLITMFNHVRVFVMEQYSIYHVALFELFIGLGSFICGIIGLVKKENIMLSFFVMGFGLLICIYFVFIYLLGEAGNPPPIRWLYFI
ncbi:MULTISPECIES: hypothetical protein [Bacillaceae]|uniref:hypothetical protein n=1 Tax=Bacillaceae TaxID=186817 RepID=UPI001E566EBD|nr:MULTISPECIES: hypothetical protein [Bacillaceae]MCE4050767.1 hypothetical protein [Bacillus sp. Au-Bac7]MCM3031611.1 hypothetical protein [Niallia sp. MER 6]